MAAVKIIPMYVEYEIMYGYKPMLDDWLDVLKEFHSTGYVQFLFELVEKSLTRLETDSLFLRHVLHFDNVFKTYWKEHTTMTIESILKFVSDKDTNARVNNVSCRLDELFTAFFDVGMFPCTNDTFAQLLYKVVDAEGDPCVEEAEALRVLTKMAVLNKLQDVEIDWDFALSIAYTDYKLELTQLFSAIKYKPDINVYDRMVDVCANDSLETLIPVLTLATDLTVSNYMIVLGDYVKEKRKELDKSRHILVTNYSNKELDVYLQTGWVPAKASCADEERLEDFKTLLEYVEVVYREWNYVKDATREQEMLVSLGDDNEEDEGGLKPLAREIASCIDNIPYDIAAVITTYVKGSFIPVVQEKQHGLIVEALQQQ